jgi:hypothetical protein
MRTGRQLLGIVAIAGLTIGGASSLSATTPTAASDDGSARRTLLPGLYSNLDARHEARLGERGANGRQTAASEQVGNRAYPRGYVDDKKARATRQSFEAIPNGPSTPWTALGPVTPNVAGEASQYADVTPTGLTGPPTQESGRVTALVADPACAPGSCRLWVAAAGGGIWRTNDAMAAKPAWIAPPNDLPTNAFGSLFYDAPRSTLYAGSGEPNGSGDSEAGLGLFKSTDFGAHWTLVPGSAAVATNRAIGGIAVDPADANRIYIGTAVARHGSSSVNGGRRTPPNAPTLGVYRSTDGGAHFTLESDLSSKAPANPTPASTGSDWFQGGISDLELDPNQPSMLYASVIGYGLWRANQTAGSPVWAQAFHTMNQTNFSTGAGDAFGDETVFDLVDLGATTRAFVGDASDDWAIDGVDSTPAPEFWRINDIGAVAASTTGALSNAAAGWTKLSSSVNGTNGYLAYYWCQNGQCGYDSYVASPPGQPDTVFLGGAMNYDELEAYNQYGSGAPPRSNGRGVIRSTNAGAGAAAVTWQDMSAVLNRTDRAWDVKIGIHPDQQAIAFSADGSTAFLASDGGVVRLDLSTTRDQSASCSRRTWNYNAADPLADPTPLLPADLLDCQRLLSAVPNSITPINDGLNTIQFQSLSFNPANPTGELLGGTQDNGTWSYSGSPTWFQSVGGDGGNSGFDIANPAIRYHNYYDATPEVSFHGSNDPNSWLAIYDPLQLSREARSFYVPFEADPVVGGSVFTGMESVWRTLDHGGREQALLANGCLSNALDPFRTRPCGDWVPIGANLTKGYGSSRAGHYVVAVERAPSNRSTLWAGTRVGRLFVTDQANAAVPSSAKFWRIDTPSTPGRFISGIAVDPTNPHHAWVSYSGYSAYAPGGHVYEVRYDPKSHKATFTDRSLNIGDQPVTGIARDQERRATYVSTDFGVLRLADGATQWTESGTALPRVAVYGLTLSPQADVLYAATHGRGAWRLPL